MDISKSQIFLVTSLFLIVLQVIRSYVSKQSPKGLRRVPGPRGWPLVGNSFQLEAHPEEQLRRWAKKYGEVFSLSLGGYNWVFVCSPEAIKEIMDKQSAATSSRIPLPAMGEVVSGGMRTILQQYNPKWRQLRAITHKLLSVKVSDTYRPSQEYEAKQLLHDLLTDNEDCTSFYTHCRRYSTSVVMTSTYGKRVPSWENENVQQVYRIMKEMSELGPPRGFLADMFPILAQIPVWMQTWRKEALKYYRTQESLWTKLYLELQSDMEKGKAPDCFVKQLIETEFRKQGISELQAAFVSGSMIEAGSETTASGINAALKYLAASPRIQEVANEYLTKVVGEDRTPTFDDIDSLQYIRAITKEIMRMRPASTIGAAHYSTADVIYKDFFIPKGTVVALAQVVSHFDERYENPYEFRPERYMNHTLRAGAYAAMPDPYQRDHFGWGAGRRICPGMHLGENSLYITIAKILWAFEIKPPLDENGNEEEMDLSDEAWEEGVITVPKPYSVRFIARSPQREKVVREEWETAKKEGYWLGNVKVDVNGMLIKGQE